MYWGAGATPSYIIAIKDECLKYECTISNQISFPTSTLFPLLLCPQFYNTMMYIMHPPCTPWILHAHPPCTSGFLFHLFHLCRKPSHINLGQCKPRHTYPSRPPCHHLLQTCICLCKSPKTIFFPWKPLHIALASVDNNTHLHQCISAALHAQYTYMILIVSNN